MAMNESETCMHLIDPALASAGWVAPVARVRREHKITAGRIQGGGRRGNPLKADYVLEYKGQKLAVIEAKKEDLGYTEGVAQAKEYAAKLEVRFTYSTNGHQIYEIDMFTGIERDVDSYPSPDDLWAATFSEANQWRDAFSTVPFEDKGGQWQPRFYQEIAINKVVEAIAKGDKRILLTLATGTGKTAIAFQIAWKLFETRWNLSNPGERRPRILFLADRNVLADQAFGAFSAFGDEARTRITPEAIAKKGGVPKNASVFFTIFQTFMTEANGEPNFGEYPQDFFDFIVVDECHRGGAADESNWRGILEYFEPAVQLGLTATPKRKDNIDTYEYFGEPVYKYSLKEGINDGFLTPFRVQKFNSNIDEYIFTPDDLVLAGQVEAGKVYTEAQFNRVIHIREREVNRVREFLSIIGEHEKTIVFCANQWHAAIIRDIINQEKQGADPLYCVRVTADDGKIGDQYLRTFQDNDKTIPTILTTSQKLSTGVDALNVRNIVLLRPINSMIEFKQIIGRGTRLFEGKDYFTVHDFVGAYHHFGDPEWDGEPITPESGPIDGPELPAPIPPLPPGTPEEPTPIPDRIVIKLRDNKARSIRHDRQTLFIGPEGKPVTAQEFIAWLFDTLALPEFFNSEEQLREIWSDPLTRKVLLARLTEAGFDESTLKEIQKLIEAEQSDLFDVLEYVAFANEPISRVERVLASRPELQAALSTEQLEFIDFVLQRYVDTGVEELDADKLPDLIKLKYNAIQDGLEALGGAEAAREAFIDFQKYLYKVG
jgi:type I restriction enzyme R subunit